MISYKTPFLSITSALLDKFFYFLITIYFVSESNLHYSLVITYFLYSSFFYELFSLSLPKTFNILFKKYELQIFRAIVGTTFFIICIFAFLTFITLLFENSLIESFFFNNWIYLFSIIILGCSIAINDLIDRYAFLNLKHNKIYFFNLSELLTLFIFLYFYLFFLEKFDIYLLILIFSFFKLFASVIKFLIFKQNIILNILIIFKKIDKKILKVILINIFPVFLISFLILAQMTFNRIFIINFKGIDLFTKFSLHFQFVEIATIMFYTINNISQSAISRILKSGKKYYIKLYQEKILNIYLVFLPISFLCLGFLSDSILLILKIELDYDLILFSILSFNLYIFFLFMTTYQFLLMHNKQKFIIIILLFSFLLNAMLCFFLINYLSILGVAIANFVSNFIILISFNYLSKFYFLRKKSIYNLIYSFFRFVAILSGMYLIFFFVKDLSLYQSFLLKIIYLLILIFLLEIIIPAKFRMIKVINNFISYTNFSQKLINNDKLHNEQNIR